MRLLGWFLLGALVAAGEPRRVVLMEELLRVEAMRSRSFDFPLQQQKAGLELSWTVKEPGASVRVLVIDRKASNSA